MGNNNLSNQIRRLRFEKGEMTQQQLADLVGQVCRCDWRAGLSNGPAPLLFL